MDEKLIVECRKMEPAYLDNNATTKPAPEVVAAMMPFFTEFWGNPSSLHRFGQRARQAVDEARQQVAALVGCSDSELLFTGGGSESVNAAIRGVLAARMPRRRIVTSSVEHSAVRELLAQLTKDGVAEVIEIPVNRTGALDIEAFKNALNDDTALATIMWANNETGVLFPVSEIAEICRARRIPYHCDGTQAVGKLPVDLKSLGIDAMSFAAHKFHGPKGVGALYLKRGVRWRPLIIGGPQERSRRGGTENVAGIVGTGIAAEMALAALPQIKRIAAMRDRLQTTILQTIDDAHVNGRTDADWRLHNTTNISFAPLEAEAILISLSELGVYASAGAACASGSLEPSHVLLAMGIERRIAHGAIRFSLSRYTTDAEVDRAIEVLPGVIRRLRSVMPVG